MLDPACGSMHFGLYAFDLYEKIYEEAWDLESQLGYQGFERSENLKPFQQTYTSREEFLQDVPRLIVEYNIHGVDIDSRAVQIAGLSLWLRAQRSWQYQGLKPQQRPQIKKSNVVCAEPMPGEKAMLEEFASKLKPRVLGQLVEIIFEKMQLAGEAGSLLKIEEEIEEVLNLAREEFRKEILFRNEERSMLFPDSQPPRQTSLFDFSDLKDNTRFWRFAEQKLLNALRKYAEEAEDSVAAQKRLFTDDAARGFAFINLFQKRYDVVLMNPPFGESTKNGKNYITDNYARSKQDLACAFVDCWLLNCADKGVLGAITTRTPFFLSSSASWRQEVVLGLGTLRTFADLGYGVLDAMVETAIYTITKRKDKNPADFIRLVKEEDKATVLKSISQGNGDEKRFQVYLNSFNQVPNSPFCYWVSNRIRKLFSILPLMGSQERNIKSGLTTGDDFRFIRAWWEVASENEARSNEDTNLGKRWVPFAKGGEYSPYYADIHLVVNWAGNGKEIRNCQSAYIRNEQYNFCPGLTWPRRTTSGISVRILPEGTICADKSPAVFGKGLKQVLGLMNATAFETLMILQVAAAAAAARSYEVGLIQRSPIPKYITESLGEMAIECYWDKRKMDLYQEVARIYIIPVMLNNTKKTLTECYETWQSRHKKLIEQLSDTQNQIDNLVYNLYGISEEDQGSLLLALNNDQEQINIVELEEEETPLNLPIYTITLHGQALVSWLIGVLYGRFDILLKDNQRITTQIDPFAPLPVCPPGMLQNNEGLPASPQDVPEDYPLRISWSGILVDDEGQSEDIVTRVREAIEVIWEEKAGDIEQEACEILGVESLRDYFRKPGNFFAEHLKRYSKSRRQAPIYWPLSTASGSYTIWLYYHRLSDQTLYRCVNDYVEPKLKQVMDYTRLLRQKSGRSRQEERALEELVNLEQELQEFRDELLRVAAFWKPDLNDGVQINQFLQCPFWGTNYGCAALETIWLNKLAK